MHEDLVSTYCSPKFPPSKQRGTRHATCVCTLRLARLQESWTLWHCRGIELFLSSHPRATQALQLCGAYMCSASIQPGSRSRRCCLHMIRLIQLLYVRSSELATLRCPFTTQANIDAIIPLCAIIVSSSQRRGLASSWT